MVRYDAITITYHAIEQFRYVAVSQGSDADPRQPISRILANQTHDHSFIASKKREVVATAVIK